MRHRRRTHDRIKTSLSRCFAPTVLIPYHSANFPHKLDHHDGADYAQAKVNAAVDHAEIMAVLSRLIGGGILEQNVNVVAQGKHQGDRNHTENLEDDLPYACWLLPVTAREVEGLPGQLQRVQSDDRPVKHPTYW